MLATLAATLALSVAPAPEPITLRFAWPREGKVEVRQHSEKQGKKGGMTYVLHWAPEPDGETMLVEFRDVRLGDLEGVPNDAVGRAAIAGAARAIGSALPKLRVAFDGTLIEVVGYEDTVEVVLDTITEGMDPETVAQLRATMLKPEVAQMVQTATVERWMAWGAQWDTLEVERGEEFVLELDTELTGGVVSELSITIGETTHHRGVECVEIACSSEADEELLRREYMRALGTLLPDRDGKGPPEHLFPEMSTEQSSLGIFAAADLRPLEVRTRKKVRVVPAGGADPVVQVEEYRYEFEWPDLEPRSKR